VYLRMDSHKLPLPFRQQSFLPFLNTHVGHYVVLHADGARAYDKVLRSLLVTREAVLLDQVDHSAHEWTRFATHELLTAPRGRVRITAGTQLLENWWHLLKHHCVPAEVSSNVALLESYALALIWRQWCNGDPMTDLGHAIQFYMASNSYDPLGQDPAFTGQVDADA
jgi:hypothetical protein